MLALDQSARVKCIVQSNHQKKINVFKVVLISRTAVVIRKPLIIQHTPRYTQNVLSKTKAQKQDNAIPQLPERKTEFHLAVALIWTTITHCLEDEIVPQFVHLYICCPFLISVFSVTSSNNPNRGEQTSAIQIDL